MNTRTLVLLLVAALATTGCITAPGGVAASNVPLDGKSYQVVGDTSGVDSAIRLFGFIPISGSNSIRDAMEDAIRRVHADALIGITIDAYTQYWILFTRSVTRVEATGVKFD